MICFVHHCNYVRGRIILCGLVVFTQQNHGTKKCIHRHNMHTVCVRTFSKVEIADTEYTKHNECQLMKVALKHTPKICHLKIRSTTKFVLEMKHGCICYVHQRIWIYKLAASVCWIDPEIDTAIFMWFNFKYLKSIGFISNITW